MAVKIRLRRIGQKKHPLYRIVVAESRVSRNGKGIEEIGTYDPNTETATVKIDEELAKKIMEAREVTVFVDMHEGNEEATAWGCDLTYDYVKINADYRS